MRHQCKVTVLDKKCFPDLQERYLADPASGPCPCFEVGQEFLFSREDGRDDFWHFGRDLDPAFPCAEAAWLAEQDFSNFAEDAYTGAWARCPR